MSKSEQLKQAVGAVLDEWEEVPLWDEGGEEAIARAIVDTLGITREKVDALRGVSLWKLSGGEGLDVLLATDALSALLDLAEGGEE